MDDGVDLEDVLSGAFPRCEVCDARLAPFGEREHLYWRCPDCGAAAISR